MDVNYKFWNDTTEYNKKNTLIGTHAFLRNLASTQDV